MSYNKYKSITDVLQEFPLTYTEKNFIQSIPIETDPYFKNRLDFILAEGVVFNSEYAICESIIHPILVELWRKYADKLLLWSHQPLNYDENLSGIPDYMVAQRSSRGKIILEQPYLIIVEAKKDNFEEGWGQCLAELVAAQKMNSNQNSRLFGIVSNGKLWEFAVLQQMEFIKNVKYYVLEDLQLLMEALNFIFSNSFEQVIY
ncbi:MAG: hypothetical protein ACK5WC_17580 [Aphanizomenon sp.]|jgi:hypothetical protein|uniref:Uncharacterized protein n=2 Tax=Aphanizomenon flos-aquae TaxID=1176 RepID=A0A1B7X353_APHFL|nr:hypothetical protein [Aphanizomenon flos-aquae Clear-A1]MBO1045199.1 hypothetical protein [Aphanizomenon flos-aquae UKL13-PB]MBO1060042.1 hypothetical protein [Aphanizomenon flos-aquae CP01]NTW21564.1 hypothetical protein [Nostocales cyanobacterium W4_Combined_metabat2_030]OBQ23537.1 MAG: hypothetical protein AN488_05240 [Anabaena sp. WA113]OBQ24974.1 MAG: hypothetical protein AN481_12645 [Aphanizomenon flos-aquae LD13]OBQ43806.1 MAG: hypothetical protein AN484_10300 [Aphanizomenon flos-aq